MAFDDIEESWAELHEKTEEVQEVGWAESMVLRTNLIGLGAGDVIDGKYEVVSHIRGERFLVKSRDVNTVFELRRVSTLAPGSRAWKRLEEVTSVTALLACETFGYVTDFGQCPDFGGYAVCEYIEGVSWAEIVRTGTQVDLEDALSFMLDVGGALSSLHEVGLSCGILDGNDLMRDKNGRWNILAPGVEPAKTRLMKAPEIVDYYDSTPSSDQFSLAYCFFGLLIGAIPEWPPALGPSDLRADVPDDMNDAVVLALSRKPSMRYESIDDFQEVVQRALRAWREPVLSGFDAVEASRLLAKLPAATSSHGFERMATQLKSCIIRMDNAHSLRFGFANIGRLRREYRRNLLIGSLFVPMNSTVPLGQELIVVLAYEPTGSECSITGMCSHQIAEREDRPPGIGIRFDHTQRDKILEWVRGIDPGLNLRPEDIVEATSKEVGADATAPEIFLISRLFRPTSVGFLRSAFNGMPFDFDETLFAMIEHEYVSVQGVTLPADRGLEAKKPFGRPRTNLFNMKERSTIYRETVSSDDVGTILHQADVHEKAGNILAMIELLERAAEAVEDPVIFNRIALWKGRFQKDFGNALKYSDRALEIDPKNTEFLGTQQWLEGLLEFEVTRHVVVVETPNTTLRAVRFDTHRDRAWIESTATGSSPKKKLITVNLERHSVADIARGGTETSVVPVAMNANGALEPKFVSGPAPIAWTADGKWFVHGGDHDFHLMMSQHGADTSTHLSPQGVSGHRAVFAPSGTGKLAWVSFSPVHALWLSGPNTFSRKICDLGSDAHIFWTADSSAVVVVEAGTGARYKVHVASGEREDFERLDCTVGFAVNDIENRRAAVVDVDHSIITYFDISSGEILARIQCVEAPTALVLRPDGFAFGCEGRNLLVIDFNAKHRRLVPVRVEKSSFGTPWERETPYWVLLQGADTIKLARIEPQSFV